MPRLSKKHKHAVTLTLNGRQAAGLAEPRMLLSDFIREQLGATGTHVGCEQGVCGACTVRVDGVVTRSCLMLAHQAHGRQVETVEGLTGGDGRLNRLQEAFRKYHALQCGFCTAGILMSVSDYLEKEPKATAGQVRDVVSGHLCRCTGYAGIMQAVIEVFEETAA
jgi:2-furoyl-CoA dehydrogenase 2Fe-2S iron sulfur subunit